MTNSEIMESLGNCLKGKEYCCMNCPYWIVDGSTESCKSALLKNIVKAINCQETIIERLRRDNRILSRNADNAFQEGLNEAQELYAEQIKKEVKAEAYKEFAENLKEKALSMWDYHKAVDVDDIDTLLKEMVGGKE